MLRKRVLHGCTRSRGTLGAWVAVGAIGLVAALPFASVLAGNRSGLAVARAAELEAEPPVDDEEAEELDQMARQVMRDNCLICHSEEMIAGQRLTRPQWKAEVEKMIGMGSPLPPEQVAPVIDFLAKHYSDAAPATTPARLTYEQALALVKPETSPALGLDGDIPRGGSLFAANCANCHGPNAQGADLGPNLVEVATLLRPSDFREVTRNGRHRMPGFKAVLNSDQENDILAWLRTKRYEAAPAK